MTPTRHTMSVLSQITGWIPDRIIESLARKHRIQARSFSATSHVMSMVYGHLAHALSLNDICDSLSSHAGPLEQIRGCTPPNRNGLSHANRIRSADMAEELFWAVYESLSRRHPEFLISRQTLQLTDFLGHNENAVRRQIWTALLTCLLLRLAAWHDRWRHPFSRFFTHVRAVLWNFFRLDSVIECRDTVRERRKGVIRGSPETACQLTLW